MAELKYFVGTPSFTRLSLKPDEIIIDQQGQPDSRTFSLLTSVSDNKDFFLNKGILNISTEPSHLGTFTPNDVFLEETIEQGNIQLEWAPHAETLKKGIIKFKASYDGYKSK